MKNYAYLCMVLTLAASLVLCGPPSESFYGQRPGFQRFLMVVGKNDGGRKRMKLRYAIRDAKNFTSVMLRLGGVEAGNVISLYEPQKKEVLQAFKQLHRKIITAAKEYPRTEAIVYYSGHSDETGLMLGNRILEYSQFRKHIDSLPATVRIGIVDACASGVLTRLKGGMHLAPFLVDRSAKMEGYAFLTSSSATESAQESDKLMASFFSHAFSAGLRGVADQNGDGKVTLNESYQYAFHQTLRLTEKSRSGPQHPSYDIQLTGTGDVVMTDLRETTAGIIFEKKIQGNVSVRDKNHGLIMEGFKAAGKEMKLALPPGPIQVNLRYDDKFCGLKSRLETGQWKRINREDMKAEVQAVYATRGPAQVAAVTKPAHVGIVPALGYPGPHPNCAYHISFNLLFSEHYQINGLQFSTLYQEIEADLRGVQLAVLYNKSQSMSGGLQLSALVNSLELNSYGMQSAAINRVNGEFTGFQAGGINFIGQTGKGFQITGLANIVQGKFAGLQISSGGNFNAGDAYPLQAAGLFNFSQQTYRGAQIAGGFNYAGQFHGMQLSAVNMSNHGYGFQAGVVNIAEHFKGFQLGLVNIADSLQGISLGVVNVIENGLMHVDTWMDENRLLHFSLLTGSPYNSTIASIGFTTEHTEKLVTMGAGLGGHVPVQQFYVEMDALPQFVLNTDFNSAEDKNNSFWARVRLCIGGMAFKRLGLFGGVSYNMELWPFSGSANMPHGDNVRFSSDVTAGFWPGYFLGIRI